MSVSGPGTFDPINLGLDDVPRHNGIYYSILARSATWDVVV